MWHAFSSLKAIHGNYPLSEIQWVQVVHVEIEQDLLSYSPLEQMAHKSLLLVPGKEIDTRAIYRGTTTVIVVS